MQQEASPAAPHGTIEDIASLLARPPRVPEIELDTAYFTGRGKVPADGRWSRELLPIDFEWRKPSDTQTARVPLQLCEFLAYKAALAYEPGSRIIAFLSECCTGVTHPRYFDSVSGKGHTAGNLADAQGYGFVFERKAFVVFRGTTSSGDWKINRIDTLTSDLGKPGDQRRTALRRDYGDLIDRLGDPAPGRHVGFSIAWASLKDQVEDWLAMLLEGGEIDRIVYTGHSLGGAMAQVAAFDHARIETGYERDRGIAPSRIGPVVTFGAPPVGGPEFAAEYEKRLGDRTVLLESSGDLVPRIMTRWYYRMLYPLRQRVRAGVQAHLVATEGFGKVTRPWTFSSEPPLSEADIDAALRNIRDAAAKAAEKLEEVKRKREQQQREHQKRAAEDAGTSHANGADRAPSQGAPPAAEPAPTWVNWAVIGVVVIAAGAVAWYFVRRKLFSHDIEQRYALYLSTLSYQQLRAEHGGDLDRANLDLAEHLRFVRGDPAKSGQVARSHVDNDGKNTAFFGSVATLPLPIKPRTDTAFIEFLKRRETFV